MSLKLNKTNFNKWLNNQITFLAPLAGFVGVLYLGAVIPKIQNDGVQLVDFKVTNAMLTAVILYVANAAYDYFRKLK